MRITNKIMQNNSLSNINANKIMQDKLNTQMSSGKKINRPSEDPVIAIRALRLRTTLSEVTQYHDKNVSDAESWLSVTEDSLESVTEALTDMIEQCNKGSNKKLTTENRKAVLESIKALRDEIYAVGDADYSGRSIFTGYRTGMKLGFQKDTTQPYMITEQMDKSALSDITYIKTAGVEDVTAGNYPGNGITENSITSKDVHRMRLSYDNLDASVAPTITYYDTTGTKKTVTAEVVSKYDQTKDAYTHAQNNSTGVVFIPETGELIFSDAMYTNLSSTKDMPGTQNVDESEIRITYQKSEWEKGDLQPEHYFYCESNGVKHNEGRLDGTEKEQEICYDVGFNQSIRVNTNASECFTHDIGRDVDDLVVILEEVGKMEQTLADLEKLAEDNPADIGAQDNYKAAKKAFELLEEKMQKMFESGITKMQGHLDRTDLAITSVGTRTSRLSLVSNRLKSQKTNFKDLVSDNEDADGVEVAINLKSAELAYSSALMATGKVVQNSLMNFI